MVGVFFSAVVSAASSSQYDGGLSRQRAGGADGARREEARLTATQSNGGKTKDVHFRRIMRIGNAPKLARPNGRPGSPMNGERRMRLFHGSYLETWRGEVMLVASRSTDSPVSAR
ncbi:hypothetical protein Q8A73_001717 [Channa argus]|nr:hypothetical protein Q8A73_001717 [Channa argus]